jgi:hypothetical protein
MAILTELVSKCRSFTWVWALLASPTQDCTWGSAVMTSPVLMIYISQSHKCFGLHNSLHFCCSDICYKVFHILSCCHFWALWHCKNIPLESVWWFLWAYPLTQDCIMAEVWNTYMIIASLQWFTETSRPPTSCWMPGSMPRFVLTVWKSHEVFSVKWEKVAFPHSLVSRHWLCALVFSIDYRFLILDWPLQTLRETHPKTVSRCRELLAMLLLSTWWMVLFAIKHFTIVL